MTAAHDGDGARGTGPDCASGIDQYRARGFASLGVRFDEPVLAALRARADQIMLEGDPRYFFQRDAPDGRYETLPRGSGWTGPGLDYRKMERLQLDPLFADFIENPLFARIAHAVIGPEVALYRAVLFTKGKEGGTHLPWHQDGGSFWGLDRDPVLQIWTALDNAPVESGCLELVPDTHRRGLATRLGGVIPDDVSCGIRGELLPARAGEVVLIHNHAWHRSGVNTTGRPRGPLTGWLMSADTRCTRKKRAPRTFQRVFDVPGG